MSGEEIPDPAAQHLEAAAQGKSESLHWLVDRFTPALQASARHCHAPAFRSFGDVEDTVQEIWAKVLARLDSIEVSQAAGSKDLLKYLGTIVLNHYRQLHRRSIRQGVESLGIDPASRIAQRRTGSSVSGIVTKVARGEMSQKLQEALDALEEKDRDVLVLRGLQQVSTEEVAVVLGISATTVSSRYRRALDRVRGKIQGSILDVL